MPIFVFSQIKVTSLISNNEKYIDKFLFGASSTRNVFLINEGWKVYTQKDPHSKTSINVPAVFSGIDELIFERKFELTKNQIENNIIKIGFLGINNSAEIYLNGNNIYNHTNGILPFEVILPNDFLYFDKSNKITIKVKQKIDSENSVPVKQRFLFPEIESGILRDVYIKILPKLFVSKIDLYPYLNSNATSGKLKFDIKIENYLPKIKFGQSNDILININIYSQNQQLAKFDVINSLGTKEIFNSNFEFQISNIIPWSPENPSVYYCEVTLVKDGIVLDKQLREISFYKFEKNISSLYLNSNKFVFKGTTYILNESEKSRTDIYDKIKNDLLLIKQTGFNSVRFAKSFPHPFALQFCNQIGLIAFVELPLNSIPEKFLKDNDYKLNIKTIEKDFASTYLNYSNSFLFGIGSGFLPNSNVTENFISNIASELKKLNLVTYSSFTGPQKNIIDNIDFYGFEIFSAPIENISNTFESIAKNISPESIFISEITYPNYKGSGSGYLEKNTYEAQAKYFEDFIKLSEDSKFSGFFINTLFQYKSVFESLFTSYSGDNKIKINILSSNHNTNNLVYKVLYSKLNNGSKVAIPIGLKKEDSLFEFILIALSLSILMAILINSKKKFREDATRALTKTYNFFSDIRDHRILSTIHTSFLMILISATLSLLFTIVLYYFKNNLLLENILLSFASTRIIKSVSYLAWNPKIAFLVFWIIAIVKIFVLTFIIKLASFFVKTKVSINNIYFVIVWAFFPATLLLPIELVLHKILIMNFANTTLLIFLLMFILWLFFRLLKGIYVLFDVSPLVVYMYSFIFILLLTGIIILKYQVTHSIIFYLENAFKQYSSII